MIVVSWSTHSWECMPRKVLCRFVSTICNRRSLDRALHHLDRASFAGEVRKCSVRVLRTLHQTWLTHWPPLECGLMHWDMCISERSYLLWPVHFQGWHDCKCIECTWMVLLFAVPLDPTDEEYVSTEMCVHNLRWIHTDELNLMWPKVRRIRSRDK